MGNSNPLGGGSALDQLLRNNLPQPVLPGAQATVISPIHKQGTEIDATLFEKNTNGQFVRVEHIHLDTDLNPK